MAHGGGLAGESEVVLDFAGAGHEAGGATGVTEVLEDFFLTGC